MFRRQFPKCKVKGSLKPVKFGHIFFEGMIPKKCSECNLMLEGGCLRNKDLINGFSLLDYGKCFVQGNTIPFVIEKDSNGYEIFVPAKCRDCQNLISDSIHKYTCSFENEIWKGFPRSLDWGEWEPNFPIVGLGENMKVTEEIITLIQENELTNAIQAIRLINTGLNINDAKESIEQLREKL